MKQKYSWKRFSDKSYEVSSLGDRRFSAFVTKMPDGRSIEMHYQCDVKAYDPGGTNWRLGKGKPPLDITKDLWKEYLNLWKIWASNNPLLIKELEFLVSKSNYTLTDSFATTDVNQARALATILNETQEIKNES